MHQTGEDDWLAGKKGGHLVSSQQARLVQLLSECNQSPHRLSVNKAQYMQSIEEADACRMHSRLRQILINLPWT